MATLYITLLSTHEPTEFNILASFPISLTSRTLGTTQNVSNDDTQPSVTELLNTYRTEAARTATTRDRAAAAAAASSTTSATLPPELRAILDIDDTPGPMPRPSFMPFMGTPRHLTYGPLTVMPAGPPPPSSWRKADKEMKNKAEERRKRYRGKLDRLPGLEGRRHRSLVAVCLRQMARDWNDQVENIGAWLAILPSSIRSALLSHIIVYGPEGGVGYNGLKALLRPDEKDGALSEFGGNDDFDRLDLSGALGRGLTFRQLQDLLFPPTTSDSTTSEPSEDWDAPPPSIPHNPSTSPLRNLKYLSLSSPTKTGSWSKLIAFTSHTPTVTHLSLAHWPIPTLTPNCVTATMTASTLPGGRLPYGGTNYYSHILDQDWSEAASLLRRLSANLYSLEWLDLDGCEGWWPALIYDTEESPGVDWRGAWGKVRVLQLRSSVALSAGLYDSDKSEIDPKARISHDQVLSFKNTCLHSLAVGITISRARGWIEVLRDEISALDEATTLSDAEKGHFEREAVTVRPRVMHREYVRQIDAERGWNRGRGRAGQVWDMDGLATELVSPRGSGQ